MCLNIYRYMGRVGTKPASHTKNRRSFAIKIGACVVINPCQTCVIFSPSRRRLCKHHFVARTNGAAAAQRPPPAASANTRGIASLGMEKAI